MDKAIDVIDQTALEIARSLDIVVYAVDGLFEKYVRENPTTQGLGQFYRAAGQIMVQALDTTMTKMTAAYTSLERTLSASERIQFEALDDSELRYGEARESFWGAFQQVRAQYVKRMREIIAAHAFGTDTFNANPKVMSRNGRRWNFSDYAYLTARRILIDRYNEAKISYIVSIGATGFYMDTNNEELAKQVFSVSNYPDIAAEFFHPRTSNLVGDAHVTT